MVWPLVDLGLRGELLAAQQQIQALPSSRCRSNVSKMLLLMLAFSRFLRNSLKKLSFGDSGDGVFGLCSHS